MRIILLLFLCKQEGNLASKTFLKVCNEIHIKLLCFIRLFYEKLIFCRTMQYFVIFS